MARWVVMDWRSSDAQRVEDQHDPMCDVDHGCGRSWLLDPEAEGGKTHLVLKTLGYRELDSTIFTRVPGALKVLRVLGVQEVLVLSYPKRVRFEDLQSLESAAFRTARLGGVPGALASVTGPSPGWATQPVLWDPAFG